jgi:hypothetical protein
MRVDHSKDGPSIPPTLRRQPPSSILSSHRTRSPPSRLAVQHGCPSVSNTDAGITGDAISECSGNFSEFFRSEAGPL